MRILWLCNIILPIFAQDIKTSTASYGGWMTGMLNQIKKVDGIDISVCFLFKGVGIILSGKTDGVGYYAVPTTKLDQSEYNHELEKHFKKVLAEASPDIVHIWGSEFPHTLAMVNACEKQGILSRVVINIQGLSSLCAKHYYASLPWHIIYRFTLRDFLRMDNLVLQKGKFEKRGKFEYEALNKVRHVIGRTDWDKACVSQVNPKVQYHFCNEILRDSFYKYKWNYNECEKNSIFVSQASYPIKGLHYMLEALPIIVERYPGTHLYVSGTDVVRLNGSLKERLKISSYRKYICELINNYKLQNHIIFTGNLSEREMCEQYLKSNVFVSPSSIENSSNSVCEAMILGVPIVASDVGGIKNFIVHGTHGYLYQHDAPYMLAYYICEVFADSKRACEMAEAAAHRALLINNKEKNRDYTIKIYKQILNS